MKQMIEAKEVLKGHIARTAALTDEQFDYVFSHFKYLSYKKGQNIIAAGDTVSSEYFVLSGCLKSFYINDDLKMYILQFAMPTWWASDFNALYHSKATINLDCITDAEVLCLSNEDRENHSATHYRHYTNSY
jgi:CRP-like cAMP-binding protein